MPPIVTRKTKIVSHMPARARTLSRQDGMPGGTGATVGSSFAQITMIATNSPARTSPGRMPAISSLPMDCSVTIP